ncbi:probable CYB2 - L-lactate dehydrogenase (cytochrome b2) [Cephalotrichum gorgonifer]|uniref:Probable CYB2 - L-lactate dehydrogenase (Cytochrome b2) n=1 Tax=Cephalotrichum gorgonifer TaxID=2041049 RepID=A0AAE8MW65_9PEZI|nr:probable CYB2 - L-lactate dehydrogenase (cytochrome b2) [Cephalotrichum gorgonifer]
MANLPTLPGNYARAVELIDEAHALDPRPSSPEDPTPFETRYARRMTQWLAVRSPDASPVLQVACRAQHFRRWEDPRSNYPMTKAGYLTWRSKQKSRAAAAVSELLASPSVQPPIPADDVSRIAALIRKENLATNEETQALEDVACLVFLDDQFDQFEKESGIDEEKMVGILRKTWGKMSEEGRRLAIGMELSERAKKLIGKALES